MRNSLSGVHPFSKVVFSIFIALVFLLLTMIIGFLVAIPIFQINLFEIENVLSDYNDPHNVAFLKYLQTLQAIGFFIIPAVFLGYLFHRNSFEYLKLNKNITSSYLFLTVFILIFSIPIINYFTLLNQGMEFPEWFSGIENWMKEKEDSAQAITLAFLKMDSLGALYFNILMIAVLPAIGEELIFRGIFQRIFSEWTKNIHWGIIIAAFLFSAMHFQFYGFLPRFILGILLGYLFYWSGSIWIPILGHFINNAAAVIVYYFNPDGVNEEIENFGATQNSYLYLIPSVILVGFLLYIFYNQRKKTAIAC